MDETGRDNIEMPCEVLSGVAERILRFKYDRQRAVASETM